MFSVLEFLCQGVQICVKCFRSVSSALDLCVVVSISVVCTVYPVELGENNIRDKNGKGKNEEQKEAVENKENENNITEETVNKMGNGDMGLGYLPMSSHIILLRQLKIF